MAIGLFLQVALDMSSHARFTSDGMLAIHEAAEQFITEKFIKADMARRHAKRKTLHIDDLLFTPYMTHIASDVVGNTLAG
jgi:histone H3/H4